MPDPIVPMTGAIICGVDGSAVSDGAVRVARELGKRLERRVIFVHIAAPGTPHGELDAMAERLRQLVDADPDRVALWLVDIGHPADRLVASAEDELASLLVVGSHGPRSSLLGSISAELSRRAPCPVVVVPPGVDGIADAQVVDDEDSLAAARTEPTQSGSLAADIASGAPSGLGLRRGTLVASRPR
jgi:nucleotide-binding universal stress UspA family protein